MCGGIVVDKKLIDAAKLAKRMTTDAYDAQVEALLNAAMLDLGVAGVETGGFADVLVRQAAITYFLMNFGEPENYDKLKRSYDEQKAQLATCTGYTRWSNEPA
jgi:hypothetical protein